MVVAIHEPRPRMSEMSDVSAVCSFSFFCLYSEMCSSGFSRYAVSILRQQRLGSWDWGAWCSSAFSQFSSFPLSFLFGPKLALFRGSSFSPFLRVPFRVQFRFRSGSDLLSDFVGSAL